MQKTSWLKLLGELITSSWWVILSILISGFIYDRAILELRNEEQRLRKRKSLLQTQIIYAQNNQKKLQRHLQFWDHPAVIEAALIQRLGLIPKGYMKIHFALQQENKNNKEP
ncbi:hypothetical protein [Chlamydia sp. 17-3921]|uniref:hypothetical protein n=1 Tax=Chlamydia sp. 17-3921 TaxID=2675798 RepID=UPI00191B6008|nr:hypothetical protein [Chlamydia sp. 17-3921]